MVMVNLILSVFFIVMIFLYSSWIALLFLPKIKKWNKLGGDVGTLKKFPGISIIIPAHNEEEKIRDTIESILRANYPKKREIVVINDGSDDRTEEILKKISKSREEVRVFNTEEHLGKANAINHGIKKSKHNIIVVLDADSELDKNALIEIVKPFRDEKIGAVSGGVIRAIDSKNPLVWFQDFEYTLSSTWRYICNNVNGTYILPGFAAFRKEALEEVNGFSNDTLTEDFDIGLKLKKKGYKLEMSPRAKIYTQVPQTFQGLMKQRIRWGRGTLQVIRKHFDVLLNKKYGAIGLYGIPTQMYWFVHGFVVLPITFYQIFFGYFQYFVAYKNYLSFSVLKYFFGWISVYGMLEYSYKTFSGEYLMNLIFILVFLVFCLGLTFNILAIMKVSEFKLRHLFVIFFFFPYSILSLILFVIFPFLYEIRRKRGVENRWEKSR
jgi:cellulose synthase/poly-beta-1,6-N-acetylglucosamine synthase-like glycosyltransferase